MNIDSLIQERKTATHATQNGPLTASGAMLTSFFMSFAAGQGPSGTCDRPVGLLVGLRNRTCGPGKLVQQVQTLGVLHVPTSQGRRLYDETPC